jgi:hypothetical protein
VHPKLRLEHPGANEQPCDDDLVFDAARVDVACLFGIAQLLVLIVRAWTSSLQLD